MIYAQVDSFGLRWNFVDKTNAKIDHTGWYVDENCHNVCRGIVARLTHDQGFLAGYSFTEWDDGLTLSKEIYNDELSAAYAADSMAQRAAEKEREYQEKESAKIRVDEFRDEISETRSEVHDLILAIKDQRQSGAINPAICRELIRSVQYKRERIKDCLRGMRELKSSPWLISEYR